MAQPNSTVKTQAVTNLDLDQYRRQNRLLLVFAPSAATPAVMAQRQHFADESAAFADRELLLFYLFDEGMGDADSHTVDPVVTADLRKQFNVTADFAVLLVGKDGGAKNRFTQPVAPEEIYSLIDAMPMRQREMRED